VILRMFWYEFFVYNLMQPIIFFGGIAGNIIGLVIFLRKKMVKVGPVHMYRILFVIDTLFLLQSLNLIVKTQQLIDLSEISSLTCKLFIYVNFSSYILSPMALFYISIEKLVSIKYPSKRFMFRKKKHQVIINSNYYHIQIFTYFYNKIIPQNYRYVMRSLLLWLAA
jgi:hypothetical protein